jgi:hypothetical protein
MTGDLPYRALWRRELDLGVNGQNPAITSTWKLDHLWRAAVLQHKAEDSLQMLQESIDANDHPDTIAHFLEQYEADCEECHRVFADGEARRAAA